VPLKYDHPPLLAPGRHILSLQEIERLCVHPFSGQARVHRERLFYAFEDLIQQLLVAKLRCEVFVDGSFFTQKPDPGDVDCIVAIESCVMEDLTAEQKVIVNALNQEVFVAGVDSLAVTKYPRDHPYFGSAIDVRNGGEEFGLEHSRLWLKGCGVMRLGETNVGLRICR